MTCGVSQPLLEPYARVPLAVVGELGQVKGDGPKVTLKVAVFLMLWSRAKGDKDGCAYGWFPNREIAETLGVSLKSVTNALSGLKRDGIISLRSAARRGRCATYWLCPGFKAFASADLDGFRRPTVDEVARKADELGYEHVDADEFVSYYDDRGWFLGYGGKPVTDWVYLLGCWEKNGDDDADSWGTAQP